MVTRKPKAGEYNEAYQAYIDLVQEKEINTLLVENQNAFLELLSEVPTGKQDFAYAEGKWTIKEMLQHITDAERVFQYRAFTGIRHDTDVVLYSFDENYYATQVNANEYTWESLVAEFTVVRNSTVQLYKNVREADLDFKVNMNSGGVVTARALLYLMCGHVYHHMNIIRERYLNEV